MREKRKNSVPGQLATLAAMYNAGKGEFGKAELQLRLIGWEPDECKEIVSAIKRGRDRLKR